MANAKEIASSTEHYFITGHAGTGKTVMLKNIQDELGQLNIKFATIAPAACAAKLCGGRTIHSFMHINFKDKNENISEIAIQIKNNENLLNLEVLIIDEISMVQAKLFSLMDQVY